MSARMLVIAICLLMMASWPRPARASIGPAWSDRDLTALAAVIVTGRVVGLAAGWDTTAGGIYTYATLEITEVLKGSVPAARITVKQLGGQVGALGFLVHDQATFSIGEDVLVFLERRPRDATLYTSAAWQGKWSIQLGDAGEAIAARQHQRRRMTDFAAAIRQWIANDSRDAAHEWISVNPPEAPAPSAANPGRPAFTFLGPARWAEPDRAIPVPIDAQFGGQPGLAGGGFPEMLAAVALWNGAGSSMRIAPSTLRSGRCFSTLEQDRRIAMSFMDPCGEISNSGATLAIGGGWYSDAQPMVVNGQSFLRFLQADLVTNDSALAMDYLTRPRCFQDIQTHELGHALGLGHSDQPAAIMFPVLDGTCTNPSPFSPRSGRLGADDIAGLHFIYPPAGAPSAPTDLIFSVSGSTVTLTWTAAPGTAGTANFVIEVGSSPGLTDLASFITASTTFTFFCAPSGEYYVRVRARSARGISPPSNEVKITLVVSGACQVE